MTPSTARPGATAGATRASDRARKSTIGLAGSVDTPALAELAHRTNGVHLLAANPEQLNAIYGSLGGLLRGNITTYETTWSIQAGSSGVFTSGRSVLGMMRVATADKTLELPFLYTIP